MKNAKMTRVKKQQKKDRNNRRFSSVLMCGLVLSGIILPSAVALAETVNNSATEQVKPATEQAKTPQATTEASKVAPEETTPSSVTPVAPSKTTATDASTDTTSTGAKALQDSGSNDTTPDNKGGVVTFYCIDAKSNKTIGMSVTGGPVGDTFSVTALEIKGYKLDTDKSDETISGTFTKQSQTFYFVYNAETPTPDPDPNAQLRGVLESTIKDAKTYLDKTKYKEAYVNKLDTAIKVGEKALQDNPAKSNLSDVDKTFQSNIDSINTAVKDVKANPVDPTPAKQDGVVRINMYNKATGLIIGVKEVKGHIGDDYTLDTGLSTYKGNKLIGSLPTNIKFEDSDKANDVYLPYEQTENSEKVPVKFSFYDSADTSTSIKVLKTITLNLTLGTFNRIADHKELFVLDGYSLDSSAIDVDFGIYYKTNAYTYEYSIPFHKNNTPTPDPTPTPDNGGGTDNNGGNGSNGTADKGSSTDKSGTNASKDKAKSDTKSKDTLPSTGESTTLVATLSGLGVLLVAGLSLVFKRKRN